MKARDKKNMHSIYCSLMVIGSIFSLSLSWADPLKEDEFYTSSGFIKCSGKLEATVDIELLLSVTENTSKAQVKCSTKSDPVSFVSVVGVKDAMGRQIFTARGFSLHLELADETRTKMKGTYQGAIGLGAWIKQEIVPNITLDCNMLSNDPL